MNGPLCNTVVRGDRCAENAGRGKDAEVQFDFTTSPGATQRANVSDHLRPLI